MTATPDNSFVVRKDSGESIKLNNWHYHAEIEFLYIRKSTGTWLVGDHIGHFQNGDVVMLGPNLPHCFRHEAGAMESGETICVKFLPAMMGNHFLELPEAKSIQHIIARSNTGLKLEGRTKELRRRHDRKEMLGRFSRQKTRAPVSGYCRKWQTVKK